MKKAAGMCLIV